MVGFREISCEGETNQEKYSKLFIGNVFYR